MAGNLPSWPGASVCYSRAYRLLERMAKAGHVTRQHYGYRRGYGCSVSQEMRDIIDALNIGGEEAIKAALLFARV